MKASRSIPPATLVSAVLVLGALVLASGCSLYNMERELPERYAEFLSRVRYLITSSERKTFLSTPDSAKDPFIEEFWKRRDPEPSTPENELQTEYFARISQADKLFHGEVVKGWLTERGRIYVLYGPPTERRIQPLGESSNNRCQEAWFYGNYPLLFNDPTCSGTYRLATFDLGPISDLSLAKLGEPGVSGMPMGRMFKEALPSLDFTAEAKVTIRNENRIEGSLRVEIPFRLIWFKSEGGRMMTSFDVTVEVRDSAKALVWEKKTSSDVSFPEREVETRGESLHVIEVPILIDQMDLVARLGVGPAMMTVIVANRTGSENIKKTIEWK